MGKLGTLFELIALVIAIIAIVSYVYAYIYGNKRYFRRANFLVIVKILFTTLSGVILTYACITSYFKMEYVAKYTDRSLPLIYKFSAFWAGQEGSLFLWAWLITVFSAIELYRIRKFDYRYNSLVFITLLITETFFLMLTTFVMNPFKELDFFPMDGLGMNPLLQNPGMIYHPPTLYIGFAGFTVTFAHAVAAIMSKDLKAFWIKNTRYINLIIWLFLTIGIVLGAQWSYVELGWGGYWAWDPVENASLFPWLTATAFLHSAYILNKKYALNNWTYILILATYELCIFATFLTRSGVIDSVHSFGKTSLGPLFLIFIILTTAIFLFIFFKKGIKKVTEDVTLSKEGLVYITNWVFIALLAVIFFGSTLPIFTQFFMPEGASVSISYYNKATTPFFITIFILLGLCNAIPFNGVKNRKFLSIIIPAFILALIVSIYLYFTGFKKINSVILYLADLFALFSVLLFIIKNLIKGGIKNLKVNKSFYSSMIIHIGILIMGLGIIFSSLYQRDAEVVASQGETIKLNHYILELGEIKFNEFTNYVSAYVPIKVNNEKGEYIITVAPERRFYRNHEESFGEVAIYSKLSHDLYIILASYSKPDNYIGIQIKLLPLVSFIWIGFIIIILGAIIFLVPIKNNATKNIRNN
ncbi:MAG: cytochrome c-type biogenesis CcmF C-terminal domain-containing protein [Deferribacterota bacterium]|nr:cytochrome c-type biogenesis CcmF C-terminal domain-containing protein [Deferribacterota bacterium]